MRIPRSQNKVTFKWQYTKPHWAGAYHLNDKTMICNGYYGLIFNDKIQGLKMKNNVKLLKFACYTTNVTMSAVANLSPILFLTFRSLYGISYSLLGTLVLVVFLTQLIVDLIFSFFSHPTASHHSSWRLLALTPIEC